MSTCLYCLPVLLSVQLGCALLIALSIALDNGAYRIPDSPEFQVCAALFSTVICNPDESGVDGRMATTPLVVVAPAGMSTSMLGPLASAVKVAVVVFAVVWWMSDCQP